jgi:hypothetical protein
MRQRSFCGNGERGTADGVNRDHPSWAEVNAEQQERSGEHERTGRANSETAWTARRLTIEVTMQL